MLKLKKISRIMPALLFVLIGCGKNVNDYSAPTVVAETLDSSPSMPNAEEINLECGVSGGCPKSIVAIQIKSSGHKRVCTGFFTSSTEVLTHKECLKEIECKDLSIYSLKNNRKIEHKCGEVLNRSTQVHDYTAFATKIIVAPTKADVLESAPLETLEEFKSDDFYYMSFAQAQHNHLVLKRISNCSNLNTSRLGPRHDFELLYQCPSNAFALGSPVFRPNGELLGMISHAGDELFPILSDQSKLQFSPTIVFRSHCLSEGTHCEQTFLNNQSLFFESDHYQAAKEEIEGQLDQSHGEQWFKWEIDQFLKLKPKCLKNAQEHYRTMRRRQTLNERIAGIRRMTETFSYSPFWINRTIDSQLNVQMETRVSEAASELSTKIDFDFEDFKREGFTWIRLTTYGVRVYSQRVFKIYACQ